MGAHYAVIGHLPVSEVGAEEEDSTPPLLGALQVLQTPNPDAALYLLRCQPCQGERLAGHTPDVTKAGPRDAAPLLDREFRKRVSEILQRHTAAAAGETIEQASQTAADCDGDRMRQGAQTERDKLEQVELEAAPETDRAHLRFQRLVRPRNHGKLGLSARIASGKSAL